MISMSIAVESVRRDSSIALSRWPVSPWHKSAPPAIAKSHEQDRVSVAWEAWQSHLRTRKRPVAPNRLLVGGERALSWGLRPAGVASPADPTGDDPREALRTWLAEPRSDEPALDEALAALRWCRRLPELAVSLSADAWWQLLDHLLEAAAEADAVGPDAAVPKNALLASQLLAGELALTLSYLFPEITACRRLRSAARRTLSSGLTHLLDRKGLLHARHLDLLRPLLACWTRCRALGGQWKNGCWNRKAEKRYRRFVKNAVRLTRRDGSLAFSDSDDDLCGVDLLLAAAGQCDGRKVRSLAMQTLTGRRGAKRRLPRAAICSGRAAAALMRTDWTPAAPRLSLLYPGSECRIELAFGRDVLLSGGWTPEVALDGIIASPNSDWRQLCWVSDKKADYLELEIELGEGLRIQRQVLLARKDRFLLLADAVLASRQAKIAYRATLPLCRNVQVCEACETREALLVAGKPRARVLPLALSEWLADRRYGELAPVGAELQLRQHADGQALYVPLFFDLDRRRLEKAVTWRRLTVGRDEAIEPADAAVGYRVAVGGRQWLFYRSLAPAAIRSVLGQHLASETLAARFQRDGNVENLVEIEAGREG